MKYQIKIIRINKNWNRIEYDDKKFEELDEVLEYLGNTLEASDGQTTLLILYKKINDGVENGGN